MIVCDFNTDLGLYIFSLDDVDTTVHQHPALEIIAAEQGSFTLWVNNTEFTAVTFAILDSNQKHKVFASSGTVRMIMVEYHRLFVLRELARQGITITNGYYVQRTTVNEFAVIQKLVEAIRTNEVQTEFDPRIAEILNYLSKHDLDYRLMIKTFMAMSKLSESRLSHLFKTNLGVSLKKYLIWSKLKSTIRQHLHTHNDLFSSLIESGFYDQPHFSKSFKTMLGISPSKVYNSRTVQFLSSRKS